MCDEVLSSRLTTTQSRGAGHTGKARTPNFGAERRQFERRSGTNPDSQKKVESGWGADDGEAELTGTSALGQCRRTGI